MANEKMLEELVEKLKGDNGWEKKYHGDGLINSEYSLQKGLLRFRVYAYRIGVKTKYKLSVLKMKPSILNKLVGVASEEGSQVFEGDTVKALYESLTNRLGELDFEPIREKQKEEVLQAALSQFEKK